MKIKFNYYLKIKNIMEKEYDVFQISKPMSLKEMFLNNISEEKLSQINLTELLVICNGKNIDNLDEVIEEDAEFSICPKIYGG